MLTERGGEPVRWNVGVAHPHEHRELAHVAALGIGDLGDPPGAAVLGIVHERGHVHRRWLDRGNARPL